MVLTTLTALEAAALDRPINLADGHAKLAPAVLQLPDNLLHRLDRQSQAELENVFLETYGSAAGERVASNDAVLFPSASLAIDTVAKFLQQSGRTKVGLLEPAFDNLALLLRRAGLDIEPVLEDERELVRAAESYDALFLVVPNNPTGWEPSAAVLEKLSTVAARSHCMIICDRTFRFFSPLPSSWPRGGDFDWITIDDTGKTWSTLECKVSFLMSSDGETRGQLAEIAEEITLNVSKFTLYIVTETIMREKGAARIRESVHSNISELSGTLLPIGYRLVSQNMSVALLELPAYLQVDAAEFAEFLAIKGLAVLPAAQFYWSEPQRGRSQIRVALARPTTLFKVGMARFCEITSSYKDYRDQLLLP